MKQTISSMVKIMPALAEEVRLKEDLLDSMVNDRRLRTYAPPLSARLAIRSVLEGFHPSSRTRVHVISGPHGAGKSHLGLVLANLVSRDMDDPALHGLLKRVGRDDEDLAVSIRQMCEGTKRYLVVLPGSSWGPESFGYSLLASVAEALREERVGFEPPAVYLAALDCINTWMMRHTDIYRRFEECCLRYGTTAEMLVDELTRYREAAYRLFAGVYEDVTRGSPFMPQLAADPSQVYEEAIRYIRSTGQWEGVIVFCDEFGRYLSRMADEPDSPEALQFQSFAEYCMLSGENQCHLVLISHQPLQEYGAGKRSQDEWNRMCGRLVSQEHSIELIGGGGEVEEVIGSMVVQQKASAAWKQVWAAADVELLTDLVQTRGLYPGKDRSWITVQLVQGCYPLHPYATFCLPWLANAVVRRRDQTLFGFLTSSCQAGLQSFVDRSAIFLSEDRLNLYTADGLFDYFREQIRSHSGFRYLVDAADRAMTLCRRMPLGVRVVKAIAVLSVVNHVRLPATEEVIREVLHTDPGREDDVTRVLKGLVRRGVLHCRPRTGRYELPGRPGVVAAARALDGERQAILESDFDPLEHLNANHPISLIEASAYSDRHFTRRWGLCRFVSVVDLSDPVPHMERIASWHRPGRGRHEGDVLVLYVLANSVEDINSAQEQLKQDRWKHPQLVVAVPRRPVSFGGMVVDSEAIARLWKKGLGSEDGRVDEEDLEELELSVREGVVGGLREFLRADNLTWHWDGNVVADVPEGGEGEFISLVLEKVFPKTPCVNSEAIAWFIDAPDRGKKDRRAAVSRLLEAKGPLQIRRRGGTSSERILRACLRDTGMLDRVSDRDRVEEFEVRDEAPGESAVKEIWDLLSGNIVAKGGKATPAGEFVIPLIEPPYGLTDQEVELYLAAFLRKRIEDTVVFSNFREAKKEQRSDPLNPRVPLGAQDVGEMVRDPDDFVVYYYEVFPMERSYVRGILRLTGADEGLLSGYAGWELVRQALLIWYRKLPSVTRAASGFEDARCRAVLELIAGLEKSGRTRWALLTELPAVLGIDVAAQDMTDSTQERILNALESVFSTLDGYARSKGALLLAEIGAMFGSEGGDREAVAEAVRRWYEGLDEVQRQHYYGGDRTHLIRAAAEQTPIVDRMLSRIPVAMGLGAFPEWQSDNSDLFLSRLMSAKQGIESFRLRSGRAELGPEDEQMSVQARARIQALLQELGVSVSVQIEVLSSLLEELER